MMTIILYWAYWLNGALALINAWYFLRNYQLYTWPLRVAVLSVIFACATSWLTNIAHL